MSERPAKLSEHFWLKEFTRSQRAERLGIDNQPDDSQYRNLLRLAVTMEEARELLSKKKGKDCPIEVSSGLRVKALNKLTPGSSKTSAHMLGLACDFECPTFGSPLEVARFLYASSMAFDEIIYEYRSWVHLALAQEEQSYKRECFTFLPSGSKLKGLLDL